MVAAIAGAVALGVVIVRALARRRVAAATAAPPVLWALLGTHPTSTPTVVAFSTPSCKECGLQARILSGLAPLRVINIDAAARPDVARAFGVLTAPSTAVLGADGELIAVNHGLARADKLAGQLQAAAPAPQAEAVIGA